MHKNDPSAAFRIRNKQAIQESKQEHGKGIRSREEEGYSQDAQTL